jgi:zinc transport system permease protein
MAGILFCFVVTTIIINYSGLFAIAFDEELARSCGINVERINSLLALLTALTVVLAMKLVGILLVSALLIIPPVAALQIARSFKLTMVLAAIFSAFSVLAGIILSFALNLPSGGIIVILNVVFLVLSYICRKLFPANASPS